MSKFILDCELFPEETLDLALEYGSDKGPYLRVTTSDRCHRTMVLLDRAKTLALIHELKTILDKNPEIK